MQADLIFDVGMHNGDDTAYYLERGYRVVAIEANPVLVVAGQTRFASSLKAGRLTILNVAIANTTGTATFWISTNDEYSSFSQENASQVGHSCHATEVDCRPFSDILAEYGVPFYLKIDIEQSDRFCLEAIDLDDAPAYVSFEKNRREDLWTMQDLGYRRFKLINQEDFRELNFGPGYRRSKFNGACIRLQRWRSDWTASIRGGTNPAKRMVFLPSLSKLSNAGRFAYGSSGPFGEDTDGLWRTLEEVELTWLAQDLGYTGIGGWFDVHCAF